MWTQSIQPHHLPKPSWVHACVKHTKLLPPIKWNSTFTMLRAMLIPVENMIIRFGLLQLKALHCYFSSWINLCLVWTSPPNWVTIYVAYPYTVPNFHTLSDVVDWSCSVKSIFLGLIHYLLSLSLYFEISVLIWAFVPLICSNIKNVIMCNCFKLESTEFSTWFPNLEKVSIYWMIVTQIKCFVFF